MSLSHGDKLFKYYATGISTHNERFSYFGIKFGCVIGFHQYIQGYINAVEILFREYSSVPHYQAAVLDVLIYPMCFCYRHIVELYIKYLFFKYSDTEESDKIDFIKQVNHKLNDAWGRCEPVLKPLLVKIESDIDISLLSEFIDEIDAFESDSFRMRYPIKKNLSSVHADTVRLDTVHLHTKMMELFEYFKRIDNTLDNVLLNNDCTEGFQELIIKTYKESKTDINTVIKILEKMCEDEMANKKYKNHMFLTSTDIGNRTKDDCDELRQYIVSMEPVHAAMIALLTNVGSDLDYNQHQLATLLNDKNKDFFKVMELNYNECNFKRVDTPDDNFCMCCALLDKKPELTSKWLKIAITLLEESSNGQA